MKKNLLVTIFLLSLSLLMANGLSLNSIGAKSTGLGGAFVGLADDATAIYWNPAGLSGQQNSVMIFASDIIPFASYKYQNAPYGIDIDAKSQPTYTDYLSPNLFVNYSHDKLAFGFGAYVPAGIGVNWDGEDLKDFNGPAILDTTGTQNPFASQKFDWMSKLGVFNFSPALSYKLNDRFSVGTALDVYYGTMKMDRPDDMLINAALTPGQDGMMDTQTKMDISGMGYGATFGLKWKCMLYDKINMGITYRTPITVKFSGTMDIKMTGVGKKDMDMDITWPMWLAYGLSFAPDCKTKINFDVQYTNWEKEDKLVAKIKDMQLADGSTGTLEQDIEMEWENALQIRLGLQRKLNDMIDLRLGYYHDPAPAPDKTLNILFPSSTNNVVTIGTGLHFNKIDVDYGMEYLFGADRSVTKTDYNMPGIHHMDIFAFSIGLKYKF